MVEELNNEFDDCILRKLHLHSGKVKKTPPKHYKNFQTSLPLKIKHIGNKGKFVFMELDKGWAIGITPGMTGHFWTPEVSGAFRTMEGYTYNAKHNHIEFETTCGSFFFNDPRMFGHLYIYSPKEKADTLTKKLKSLGPDLLKDLPEMKQNEFNELLGTFKGSTVLADLLLNQKFISGVGNYIRAEVMYLAKLHPMMEIKNLTADDKKRLKKQLERVGNASYHCQKSHEELHTFNFKVYRQKNAKSIHRKGRTIWYDPDIQKK